METDFRTGTTRDAHYRWRTVFGLGAAASTIAVVVGLIASHRAPGEVAPLQIIPVAQSSTPTKTANLHEANSQENTGGRGSDGISGVEQ